MSDRQRQLERTCSELGKHTYREKYKNAWSNKDPNISNFEPERMLIKKSITLITDGIKTSFENPASPLSQHLSEIEDPYELAFLTARHCINTIPVIETTENTYTKLTKAVCKHLDYVRFRKQKPKEVKWINHNNKDAPQYVRMKAIEKGWRKAGIVDTDWDSDTCEVVGRELVNIFIDTTGLMKIVTMEGHSVLRPTEKTLKWLMESHIKHESAEFVMLPMIEKPLLWKDIYDGGYHTKRSPLLKSSREENLLLARTSKGISNVYKALNAIQETPWRINTRVFEVIKEGKQKGLKILPLFKRSTPESPTEKRNADKQWEQDKSERSKLMRQLWLADAFKDRSEFFFPWNLDWRGRLYPLFTVPVHPQSDDIGKALIKFARGKQLGQDGAYWLAVHGANCHGESDKESLDDRVKWIEEYETEILNSARDPLGNYQFWSNADEPFQFLSFCFEWQGYREQGVNFISHLPVAIDASCNGIQHLSHMAGDIGAAFLVNAAHRVAHDEKPQDFYGIIAGKVSELVDEDANNDHKIAQLWQGKVTRKIVKRNVMTLPYGATLEGFRGQLLTELKKLDSVSDTGSYLGEKANREICSYLAEKNQQAIKFTSNKIIKTMEGWQNFGEILAKDDDFLGLRAASMKKYRMNKKAPHKRAKKGGPFTWLSPVGLTIQQNYSEPLKSKKVDTLWEPLELVLSNKTKIDVKAVKRSIVPNYVHSHDASHMMFTVLGMLEKGIQDFCMIHDSFGCHASDAGIMENVIWDKFEEIYPEQREKFWKIIEEIYLQASTSRV